MRLYIVKDWLIRLIPALEQEISDQTEEEYEFASFGDDFIPFIAKNQFKSQIRKYAPMPKKDPIQEKIAMIMNPSQTVLSKDYVRVQI